VKVAGSYTMPVSQERAYTLLQDPVILARCMPGVEALDLIGPDEYKMKMKMAVAGMSGLFDGKVRIADPNPVAGFRLIVEGTGKIGFMKGEGQLDLTPADTGTRVSYAGDVQVGGAMAGIGQRLIDTTAKMLIKRFFEKLATEASAATVA
jgi:carbon monoxide dehydrogenase subunit G